MNIWVYLRHGGFDLFRLSLEIYHLHIFSSFLFCIQVGSATALHDIDEQGCLFTRGVLDLPERAARGYLAPGLGP